MAKASDQFRQSDVALWGIVALVCGGLAVLGANISALVPQSVLAGLHTTRLEGASVEQLRRQVADLREEARRLDQSNKQLEARLGLEEQEGNEVVRRVGALEVTVPRLLEVIPPGAAIDTTTLTSSIGADDAVEIEAEGGTVRVTQRPMPGVASAPADQPIPQPVASTPESADYGIAIGPAIADTQAPAAWRDLNVKLGPLLFGLAPLIGARDDGTRQIVAGPVVELAEATELCARFEQISVPCTPVPYTGTPLDR